MNAAEQTTEQTSVITITDAALAAIRKLLVEKNAPGGGVRVFASGGGFAGLQYGMRLDMKPRSYDQVIEQDGVKVFVDPTSMMQITGAVIDYQESARGGGFKIDNPNAAPVPSCRVPFNTNGSQNAAAEVTDSVWIR
jgi:iron-sulfur cluster assembly accessory protein